MNPTNSPDVRLRRLTREWDPDASTHRALLRGGWIGPQVLAALRYRSNEDTLREAQRLCSWRRCWRGRGSQRLRWRLARQELYVIEAGGAGAEAMLERLADRALAGDRLSRGWGWDCECDGPCLLAPRGYFTPSGLPRVLIECLSCGTVYFNMKPRMAEPELLRLCFTELEAAAVVGMDRRAALERAWSASESDTAPVVAPSAPGAPLAGREGERGLAGRFPSRREAGR